MESNRKSRHKTPELADPLKVDQLPPHSIDVAAPMQQREQAVETNNRGKFNAERTLLACLFSAPEHTAEFLAALDGGPKFTTEPHITILNAIRAAHVNGRALSAETVQVFIDPARCDAAALGEVVNTKCNPVNFPFFLELLGPAAGRARKRRNPKPPAVSSVASEHPADDSKASAATQLVKLAEEFEFFHDPQSRGFARMAVNGHVEVWPVNSMQFRNLLAQMFYRRTKAAVNRNALADAIATLQGRALFDGPEEQVHLRVAQHGENILIDMCDPRWRVIKVCTDGWELMDKSPMAFIRTSAMRPLPVPALAQEGSLDVLWELLNVTPAQRPLVAGALLNGFHPLGPYFAVNYVGEQGTGKSCAARIHRQLIDPSETPLRSPPREDRDLLVQANSNWIVALDNLSKLPGWLSDGLCRLATGGGHSARTLFTDLDEISISVKRPVILNGIEDVAARPDLAERALQIELDTIPDHQRRSERELWEKFDAARPVIFSAILNGLACALREQSNVRMDSKPRMADAAIWATAGETAFGMEPGAFMIAHSKNLNDGAAASIEAHPVGVAIQELLEKADMCIWSGEPAQLLKSLNANTPEDVRRSDDWPETPRALSGQLRRLAQAFRRSGIDLTRPPRGKRRLIRLCSSRNPPSAPSAPSQSSPNDDANDGCDARIHPLHGEAPAGLVEEIA